MVMVMMKFSSYSFSWVVVTEKVSSHRDLQKQRTPRQTGNIFGETNDKQRHMNPERNVEIRLYTALTENRK